MNIKKLSPEQGQAVLVAVNKLVYGLYLLAQGKEGSYLTDEAKTELQALGVPLE